MSELPGAAAEQGRCEVLIVGGGPTGLFLAALLARRGVDVVVLERRAVPSRHSRAIGLHPPALRALRELGLERAASEAGVRLDRGSALAGDRPLGEVRFGGRRTASPYVLSLPQTRTEELLTQRLGALAPQALHRGWTVTAVEEHPSGVEVTARRTDAVPATAPEHTDPAGADGSDQPVRSVPSLDSPDDAGRQRAERRALGEEEGAPGRWRAELVVVADGSRSGTRTRLGIPMRGRGYRDSYLMGDFADADAGRGPRRARIHLERGGVVESFPMPEGRRRWVVHTGCTGTASRRGAVPRPASAPRLTSLVKERLGAGPDPETATMLSAFTVAQRRAARLCTARCMLVGDAAHEVSPIGGQGMTLGWLDALEVAPLIVRVLRSRPIMDLATAPESARVERRILRRARWAGWIAGVNTVLGRPAPGVLCGVRAAALVVVLRSPARTLLAWLYSMGWTDLQR